MPTEMLSLSIELIYNTCSNCWKVHNCN